MHLKESIRRLLREDNNELGGRITVWLSTQYDKVFDNLDLYVEVDQENIIYGKWYDKEKDVIFSRNHYHIGVFWIHDCESYRLLRSHSKLLSINTDEFDQSLIMYLNNRYIDEFFGRPIQYIGDEFNCLDDDMNLQESIRRILREELLNESRFFHRRVDLDKVRKLLPIYAEQVHYETKSYEQFKYELTLNAVEAIMWSEYELGWNDLPEQEEIEFVNKVSDIFEEYIKLLYNNINR